MQITGKYLLVKKIDRQPNYMRMDLGEGEKQQDGTWKNFTWFGAFVVGKAKSVDVAEGDKIEITQGKIVMQKYNEKWSPSITIFEMNVMQKGNGGNQQGYSQPSAPVGMGGYSGGQNSLDSDIPF